MISRGIRNNNPLNIRRSKDKWLDDGSGVKMRDFIGEMGVKCVKCTK